MNEKNIEKTIERIILNPKKYNSRYEGERFALVYGAYSGVEKFAFNEIASITQDYLRYCVEIIASDNKDIDRNQGLILVGTVKSNKLIAELAENGHLKVCDKPEGYTITRMESPWVKEQPIIVIAGADENGVLYGVQDFNARELSKLPDVESTSMTELEDAFHGISDFHYSEYPLVENRGVWTWGHVVYDYQAFLNNMARLKMNMITVWFKCPPINLEDIISYAHSKGIKFVAGFSWGWGTPYELETQEDIEAIKKHSVKTYLDGYKDFDIDGIYFQTKTEHDGTEINGKSIASIACKMVNEITEEILAITPGIQIQFGLHATSIVEKYVDLADLHPEVTITWEDAGAIPFSYNPVGKEKIGAFGLPVGHDTFEATLEYSKKLATFRENAIFAIVPKGWICTGGGRHKDFVMGVQGKRASRRWLEKRQADLTEKNEVWERNFHYAKRFYSEIIDLKPKSIIATALIESGMFETFIQPSYALFAEMLWNPKQYEENLWEASQKLGDAANNRI